jgi:hypothetical protein
MSMSYEVVHTTELEVVVGDNDAGDAAHPSHCADLNGIWSLTSVHEKRNCFVPRYAGLNLEHLMDGLFATDQEGDTFEPRHHPMQVERISDRAVRLVQSRTPQTHVESSTIFEVKEPNIIDFHFTAKLHQPPRAGKQFGFFWASYINAPDFPCLFFLNPDGFWNCLSPDMHGTGSTVCHSTIDEPQFGLADRSYNVRSLAHGFSDRRFDLPLVFGRPHDGNMLYLQMFDQTSPVRLTMSPTGGDHNEEKRVYNPAWDYQFVIDDVETGKEYHLRSRLVYKAYGGRQEVIDLFSQWKDEIDE